MSTERVGVIDYGLGNVGSIRNMLRRIGVLSEIISSPQQLYTVKRAILPGIGNFGKGMRLLRESGWDKAIQEHASAGGPLLGICLGMQMLMDHSAEGEGAGLGLIEGEVRYFEQGRMQSPLQIPHMGWNQVAPTPGSKLLANLPIDARFYFVHSLHVDVAPNSSILPIHATYGYEFVCGLEKGNIFGVQFHPEKSHIFGMTVLRNFCEIPC